MPKPSSPGEEETFWAVMTLVEFLIGRIMWHKLCQILVEEDWGEERVKGVLGSSGVSHGVAAVKYLAPALTRVG